MIAASDGARLVGYARVSTQDQDLALQIDALLKYGVAKELIFTDKASGAKHQRPGLDACLAQLHDGMSYSSGGWIGWADRCATS